MNLRLLCSGLVLWVGLSACQDSCSDKLSQERLDEMYREFIDPNILQFDSPNEVKATCRYLDDNEELAVRVYNAFSLIKKNRYIMHVCESDQVIQVVASPKYLKSNIDLIENECVPQFNPLGLSTYEILYSVRDARFSSMRVKPD